MKTISFAEAAYGVGVVIEPFPGTKSGRFVGVDMVFTKVGTQPGEWPSGVDYTKVDGTVDSNVVLVASMESSMTGQNWTLIGEVPFVGGLRIDRNGQPILTASCAFQFTRTQPGGGQSKATKTGAVRARLNVLVPLTTAWTAHVYEEDD